MSKYKIEPIETKKSTVPLKKCMKKGMLPKFPFSMVISGRSGSGKTMVLLNMLTNKEMYKGYFHYIAVFSPTAGEFDDTYDVLKLPKENFIKEFTPDTLNEIIQNRKKLIKQKGIEWVAKHSRVLLILDDVIADRAFLASKEAITMFSLLRHYLCSVIVLIQRYNKVPPVLRTQANATIIFPSARNEIEILKDELTPPQLTKKQFEQVIHHATSDKHSFLMINNHCDKEKRFRKNIDEFINLHDFV